MGNVRFTSRIGQWAAEREVKADKAMLEMATDIHRVSAILAPKDKRNLVNSGRIKRVKPGHYEVIYGGGAVPYARRRHFENKKNPGSIGYLERGGAAAVSNIRRYFKEL